MFEGVFIAAAHHERELIPVSLEDGAEVEPIGLVISQEACCCGEVEQAVMAAKGMMKLVDLGVSNLIALGPHHAGHHLEQRERSTHSPAGPFRKTAQDRRGEPRVSVPVREQPAIEYHDPADVRPARGFPPLRSLKSAAQMLQDHE